MSESKKEYNEQMLENLIEEAKWIGWDTDYTEICEFIRMIARRTKQEVPDLNPYPCVFRKIKTETLRQEVGILKDTQIYDYWEFHDNDKKVLVGTFIDGIFRDMNDQIQNWELSE